MSRDWRDDPEAVATFQEHLLAWYGAHKRQMNWRDSANPYHIWISEIMLQQTRVEQMGAYFDRFIAAFPTVEALAAASTDEVLKVWEGLGYYARARNMHRAAQRVVDELGGRIPDTYEGLIDLPGIGEYTAAAVASIVLRASSAIRGARRSKVITSASPRLAT